MLNSKDRFFGLLGVKRSARAALESELEDCGPVSG
jgi:hypothetical protein